MYLERPGGRTTGGAEGGQRTIPLVWLGSTQSTPVLCESHVHQANTILLSGSSTEESFHILVIEVGTPRALIIVEGWLTQTGQIFR